MDRATTAPPRLPKLDDLTPEERQKLLAQGWTAGPDGTLAPPLNGGGPPKAYDLGAGGYGAALGGPPATRPPAGMPSAAMGMGMPEAAPDALNARIEIADMPLPGKGTNPMAEAEPAPFEVPVPTPPLRAQPAPDLKAAAAAGMNGGGSGGGLPGRIGRRQQSRSSPGRTRTRRR